MFASWWEGLDSDFAPIVRIPPKSDNPSGAARLSHPQGDEEGLTTVRPVSGMIVTLDGPGGTGKSTVSRLLAIEAGLPHLDTGAYYRAATLAVIEAGVDPADEAAVVPVVRALELSQDGGHMYVDGRDVSEEIRTSPVTAAVSTVSAHPKVRQELVKSQRAWIENHDGQGVVEGRDIGSVVFPDADLKIYLDASSQVRAERRSRETGEDLDAVLADLKRRDHLDSTRMFSPLTIPDGAIVVDTSDLSIDEVVDRLLALVPAS